MTNPIPPFSPLWWLRRLDAQLSRRQKVIDRWDAYYRGEHPLLFVGAKFADAFSKMFRPFADNWMPIVCDSPQERMHVEGFRFGEDGTGDADAWYIWQANNLDTESRLAFREMFVCGIVYFLVDPTVELGDKRVAGITVEHPNQVIVATDPGNRRVRRAALKRWRDDDGRQLATVYLPDRVYKYQRDRTGWVARVGEALDQNASIPNPLSDVPIVPMVNRDRLLRTEGVAEHNNVIPLQDLINKLMCDMVVASEFAAFRQRWATGLDIPIDPETKKPKEPFDSAVNRLWVNENPEGKFGDLEATDLANFVKGIVLGVQHLGAQSRTPPHYMLGEIVNAAAAALKAAETGLISKVYERQGTCDDPLEETERLAFKSRNDKRALDVTAEVVWGDPESRSEAEHVDATVKKLAAGVPLQQIWLDLGYSPQKIARFRTMLREQALEQASLGLDVKNLFGADVIDAGGEQDGGEQDDGAAA